MIDVFEKRMKASGAGAGRLELELEDWGSDFKKMWYEKWSQSALGRNWDTIISVREGIGSFWN